MRELIEANLPVQVVAASLRKSGYAAEDKTLQAICARQHAALQMTSAILHRVAALDPVFVEKIMNAVVHAEQQSYEYSQGIPPQSVTATQAAQEQASIANHKRLQISTMFFHVSGILDQIERPIPGVPMTNATYHPYYDLARRLEDALADIHLELV